MNVPVRCFPLAVLAAVLLLGAQVLRAQTIVTTNPVGYVQLTCSAGADTTISVPFQQPAAFIGAIASISGSTLTVNGASGWAVNQYLYSVSGSTYYAQFGPYTGGTDPWDGSYYTVVANGTNTLTIDTNSDNIATAPVGSTVSIIPYWTIGTVFPPSMSGTSFIPSTALTTETQIQVPNVSGTGTNLGLANTYFFYNGAWRRDNYPIGNSYSDDILLPDTYITVRNPDKTTTLTAMGSVATGNFMIGLNTVTSGAQDNPVAVPRPVDTTLDQLGLITSGAFKPSTSPLTINDQLIVLSSTGGRFSPPPSASYYYYAGSSGTGWQENNFPFTLTSGTAVIPAGAGFIIRKVATGNGTPQFWQNPPSY